MGFASLKANKPTRIAKYNKALFSGQGDRLPPSEWDEVNNPGEPTVDIVLFEGWCVGFQPLTSSELRSKHAAVEALNNPTSKYCGRLGYNTLESVLTINDALKQYSELWAYFHTFVHIDAADPLFVYRWRLQQEATTRREKGAGMTDEQVENFVNGYYPAYELYTETLRRGVFRPAREGDQYQTGGWEGRQLRFPM